MLKDILKISLKELGWFVGISILVLIFSWSFFKLFDFGVQTFWEIDEKIFAKVVYPSHLIISLLLQNFLFLGVAFLRRNSEQPKLNNWKSYTKKLSVQKMILYGIVIAFILLVINSLQHYLLLLFFDKSELVSPLWSAVISFNTFEKLCIYFLGVIIAPVVEELYYREVVCGSIFRLGFPNFAIFFSSAIFSIVHRDFVHIFGYLTVSAMFAIIYLKTRSVIPTITAHIIYNFIAISIFFFT